MIIARRVGLLTLGAAWLLVCTPDASVPRDLPSSSRVTSGAAPHGTATVYFFDDFESGCGNWTLSGSSWDCTAAAGFGSAHSLTDSPGGNYGPLLDVYATLTQPMDFTAVAQPILTFWHKYEFDATGDRGYLEVSTNGGASWTSLRSWSGYQRSWTYERYNLYAYAGRPDVRFRFHLHSDSDAEVGDGWYVDNVRIEDAETTRLPYPFAEPFEVGLGNWLTNGTDWALTTNEYFSATHSLTDSPGRNYLPSLDTYVTLIHSIDLSAAVKPVLTFWHKYQFDAVGDRVYLEISIDGGQSWTSLRSWSNYQLSWTYERYNLYNYVGRSDVKIRFHFYSDGDAEVGDGWSVDDVRIDEADATRLPYPFADHFEDCGNWRMNDSDWTCGAACAFYDPHSLYTGPYGPSLDVYATQRHPMDLSAADSAVVTFWHKHDFDALGDRGYLEISTNGGQNWTSLRSWSGDQPSWTFEQYNLTAYAGAAEVSIRFRLHSDDDTEVGNGWCIEYLAIVERWVANVGAPDVSLRAGGLALSQNHPNPFARETTIRFEPEQPCFVVLEVFAVDGRHVRTLVAGERPGGSHAVVWDGRDEGGRPVASGIYFCLLRGGAGSDRSRMVLIR